MPQKRLSGTAYITADGTTLAAKGNFEVPLSEYNRTEVIANGEVIGYDEQPVAPYVKGDIQLTDETDVETLMSSTNMTVKVDFANSWKYVLSEAFIRGTPTTSETGQVSLDFGGKRGQLFK